MNEQEVIELMKSSRSEEEWEHNCDLVKSKYNGGFNQMQINQ